MANVVEAFDKCKTYEYRYTHNDISYISPPTAIPWSYDTYVEVPGIWKTSHGESFECRGGEKYETKTSISHPKFPRSHSVQSFGIGCSEGPGEHFKVMPVMIDGGYLETRYQGKGTVCQDKPNYWNDICPLALFSFRCYTKWTMTGNFRIYISCKILRFNTLYYLFYSIHCTNVSFL